MSIYFNPFALASLVLILSGMSGIQAFELPTIEMPTAETATDEQKHCLRCHSMQTLGYRDPVTGGLVNLHIPEEGFKDSNHQALGCKDCHKAGFQDYPHPPKAKQESLYCVDCHEDNPNMIPSYFAEIEREFKESVHFKRMPEHFSCFSCHNAHFFKASRKSSDPNRMPNREMCLNCHAETDFEAGGLQRDINEMVAYDNHICLDCHAEPGRIADLKSGEAPDLLASHDWMPNIQMHWKKVRCIDCHLSTSDTYMHQILDADQAVKHCEDCHSANSILLTKLYKYKMHESRQKYGFLNSVTLNEAYIIGMTRNVILDQLSFLIMGAMVLGITAHGTARWVSNRRRKR
ncbi:MAG: cytochrome c3 family protein [Gammaproteobacteria bacterium]|nr:cytochrome c3 family protein [Gammaproteobacteria bacterium]